MVGGGSFWFSLDSQQSANRRRPPRLRKWEALPLPAWLQAKGHQPKHHRIQIWRNLRRDQEQDSKRQQLARDHRPHRRTALPLPDRAARTLDLYEAKIRNMGNAGRNGGEYYTPRPLIRTIVQVVKPRIGERIYDGAVGSAGFLCESFEYLTARPGLTTKD